MAIPGNTPDKITYFAETDYRSKRIKFGIRDDDRARHMYIIGKTGMGKSTLLENLAIQDIQNGEGLCFVDPHGSTAETLLSYVPEHRMKDVVYFAPFDQDYPIALNVMEDIGKDKRSLVASGLIGAFKKVWVDAWSARMEYILTNELLALLEYPGSTLLGVNRMLSDKNFRAMIVNKVQDPSVKAFWVDEFAKYSDKFMVEAGAAIQNKVGQFSANPLIRNIIGQSFSKFDIRKLMDERKIFIVNLSKGRLGEGNANLIGSMIITKIYLAAMSRAEVGPEAVKDLPPFYLYVDEFQSFANESFADILSEARKYKLSLTIAHQYIEQMSDEVRAAVFGNVGTMISFRVGSYDAEVLEKEFAPAFIGEDIVSLGFAQIYLKLMINGVGSPPFSATTLPRPKLPPHTFVNEVIATSREQFARSRAEVEDEIRKWHEPIPEPPRDPNAPSVPETRKYAPGTRPPRSGGGPGSGQGYGNIQPPRQYLQPQLSEQGMPMNEQVSFDGAPQQTAPSPWVSSQPSGYAVPHAPYSSPAPIVSSSSSVDAARVSRPEFRSSASQASTAPLRPPNDRQLPASHQPFKEEFAKLPLQPEQTQTTEPPPSGRIVPDSKIADQHLHPERVVILPEYVGPERRHHEGKNSAQPPVAPASVGVPTVTAQGRGRLQPVAPLSTLKSQPKKDKGPSEGNLSSLRAVLDAALAGGKNTDVHKEADVPPIISSPQVVSPQGSAPSIIPPAPLAALEADSTRSPRPSSLLGETSPASTQKEVPEALLRSVLLG